MNDAEYSKMYELEDSYWWYVGRRNLALKLLPSNIPSHLPFLDLGCGTGVLSGSLQAIHHLVSLDFSSLALEYCQKRGIHHLVSGDGAHLPFRSDRFGALIALDIFEHIKDDQSAFSESYRVLSPGGVLILSVPAFQYLWGPHDVALHHFRRYNRRELCGKLESAGFQIEKCSHSVFLLFPLVVFSRMLDKFKRGEAKAHLPSVPKWLNRFLIQILERESMMIQRWNLPWGSSLVVVARKR